MQINIERSVQGLQDQLHGDFPDELPETLVSMLECHAAEAMELIDWLETDGIDGEELATVADSFKSVGKRLRKLVADVPASREFTERIDPQKP